MHFSLARGQVDAKHARYLLLPELCYPLNIDLVEIL